MDVGVEVGGPVDLLDVKVEELAILGRHLRPQVNGVLADEPPRVHLEEVDRVQSAEHSFVQSNLETHRGGTRIREKRGVRRVSSVLKE